MMPEKLFSRSASHSGENHAGQSQSAHRRVCSVRCEVVVAGGCNCIDNTLPVKHEIPCHGAVL